ncbi:hypothetical protein VSR82_32765 [Burkholderia sp. JPY481]
MKINKRNGRASLYRLRYVRKGAEGNTHGFHDPKFVGSLPLDSQEIPEQLAAKLTPAEIADVDKKVIVPARRAAEYARREEEAARSAKAARERDPRWRIEEALRLLTEAETLASDTGFRMDATRVKSLYKTLDAVAAKANARPDPLDEILRSVVSATTVINSGHYGLAPAGNVRDTAVYKRWRSIDEAVNSGRDSLLKALQAKGWVKVRG